MPPRDTIHNIVKQALVKDGWEITDDPYVISYGERFLFVDLAATDPIQGQFIGAARENSRIAIEIKEFRGQSAIADLEQALGQYILYRLLLSRIDAERELYLAVTDITYSEIFSEPIGELVIAEIPLKMLVINLPTAEVQQWIPPRLIETS
ncbi:XisH family protein [Microseira wollei]|uniref:FdxN element excision controlling factor protein n=1 Tax=Microseira wollei NIES-4236 TaxID=2530354 RepID=A0AAV3XA68_9CYAN|nr:XisH family protein [Microseira wollei]GET37526.1 fdxN element excision controlling factor protein [Microseira wollei NIES-4236]